MNLTPLLLCFIHSYGVLAIFNILNYIYMNPVKANLVEEPEEWECTYINEGLL